jgi:hypothetical protein
VRVRRTVQFAAFGLLISAALELLAPAAALAAGDAAAHSAKLFMWIAVILTTLTTPPILTLLIGGRQSAQ